MIAGVTPARASDVRSIVSGGARAMTQLTRELGQARGELILDMYQLGDSAMFETLARHSDAGQAVRVLADQRLPNGRLEDALRDVASQYVDYGDNPQSWQHAKAFHMFDRTGTPVSWVGNLAPIDRAYGRTELSIVVRGETSEAARSVTEATLSGDAQRAATAIDNAAGYGLLYNDPWAQRAHLTQQLRELQAPSSRDLLHVSKGWEHDPSTRELVKRAREGRDVTTILRDVAKADAEVFSGNDVPVWVVDGGLQPRVNATFAGSLGLVSSSFVWGPMIDDLGLATSRDLGVLIEGANARLAREAVLDAVESMPSRRPISQLVEAGDLPAHI